MFQRYDWGKRDDGEWDILPFTDGDYVKYADVAHLEQQAARMANLPGLPEGWVPPFTVYESSAFVDDASYVMDAKKRILNTGNSKFIAALLNTCYPPAPGQEGGKA